MLFVCKTETTYAGVLSSCIILFLILSSVQSSQAINKWNVTSVIQLSFIEWRRRLFEYIYMAKNKTSLEQSQSEKRSLSPVHRNCHKNIERRRLLQWCLTIGSSVPVRSPLLSPDVERSVGYKLQNTYVWDTYICVW